MTGVELALSMSAIVGTLAAGAIGAIIGRRGAIEAARLQTEALRREGDITVSLQAAADLVGAAAAFRRQAQFLSLMTRQPIPYGVGTLARVFIALSLVRERMVSARHRLGALGDPAVESAADDVIGVADEASVLIQETRWWEFLTWWRDDPRWDAVDRRLRDATARLEGEVSRIDEAGPDRPPERGGS